MTDLFMRFADAIVSTIELQLGEMFVPANIRLQNESLVRRNHRAIALAQLRDATGTRGGLTSLDRAAMHELIPKVSQAVVKYRQGACGELAMMAYNVGRQKSTSMPIQIMEVPERGAEDSFHAFVLVGLFEEIEQPTSFDDIIGAEDNAAVVDLWFEQTFSGLLGSGYNAAFPVAAYRDALASRDRWDMSRVKTMFC